ncbi:MAG TPA: ribose 5-phosphate isomerase B [Candidatus Atribacteria bacterium]|nr:ribose 5-phosphate isomerase B [Candidatus Atribacteria bacterium]
MKIVVGSDHGGFDLKEDLKAFLTELGHEVEDYGVYDAQSSDYPDVAFQVAEDVAKAPEKKGILICGTGIGMSIAANKVKGVRASLCHDTFSARCAREDNDANILTLGGRVLGKGLAREIARVWLEASFTGGRHTRRLGKIEKYENSKR